MLPVDADTIRLFLHLLAATVWVGGQLTLAGLLPALRGLGPDAPRTVARRFNLVAWPAYGVLLATGLWNLADVQPSWTGQYGATLLVKLLVVALSGIAAAMHVVSRTRVALAVWGAVTGASALAALFLGVMLRS